VRGNRTELARIVEALIFTLIVSSFYAIVAGGSPIVLSSVGDASTLTLNSRRIGWLLAIAVALPTLLSLVVNNDWHMALARKARLTEKTSRSTIWLDVFYDIDDYIILNLSGKRPIAGWPEYFSHDPREPYIFLTDANWIENNEYGETFPGILITPDMGIESIELLPEPVANEKGVSA